MSTSAATDLVCISRPLGAGGEAVGRIVADELGFRYVDEEIVERAAAKVGVSVDLVADAETRKSLTSRVLKEILLDAAGVAMMSGMGPVPVEQRGSDDYRSLIEQVIRETAEEGRIVIVAHAASVALAGRPGLVRVLVTASPDVRTERLASELDVADGEARKLVKEGDLARSDYLKRFYGVKEEEPTLYDVVVNTDTLQPEVAARVVLTAAADTSS